ncbi:MAG: ATP-binding protein, partial [Syntrophorhabdaceae bacterium]
IEAGHKVLFLTLESMLTRLTRARLENRVERQIQQFVYPKVLIIDGMGYLPMSRDEAGLFFRLLSRRYEKAATIMR